MPSLGRCFRGGFEERNRVGGMDTGVVALLFEHDVRMDAFFLLNCLGNERISQCAVVE